MKWAEAARLHRAFAEKYPDSPLARVALEQRLPAIAAKKAFPHDCDDVDRTVVVGVRPRDRKRKATPIYKETAYNAHLDIVPLNGWRIRKSEIIIWWNSRGVGRLWYGPNPATPDLHRYHLCDAYSSQEYVMIEGELYKPVEGPGKTANKPNPPFRVTVPSVDVDWEGFVRPHDEDDEERRFIIVPLNRNGNDDKRWIELNSPYDDDERELRPSFPYGRPVNPVITLNWEAANCLGLLRDGTAPVSTGWLLNAKTIPDSGWPLRFLVDSRQTAGSFIIFVEGQEDDVREKALDTIHGRIVNVDIDVDADYDGDIDDNDESLEETRGGFVGVDGADLTPIKLSFGPLHAQLPGKLKLSATKGGNHIRLWRDAQRSEQVILPMAWQNPSQIPATLYVEGVTPSANVRDVELTLEYDENPNGQNNPRFKCADKIALTVVKINLMAYRPTTELQEYGHLFLRHAVPDELEESPGVGIRINGDAESSQQENDLIEVQLEVRPAISTHLNTYLKRDNSSIRVWNSPSKTTCLVDTNMKTYIDMNSQTMSVWVENPSGGEADLDFYANLGKQIIGHDKIHFYPFSSVVVFFEGEFGTPSDPPNSGISTIALAAYTNGYDVHVFDEPDMFDMNNSEKLAFEEIKSAVNKRRVDMVALIGYSHGGGSVYNVSKRLNDDSINYDLGFTAYIDAISQPLFNTQAETRRPCNSTYHVNYFQVVQIGDSPYLLSGASCTPPGAGYEENVDTPTPTKSHVTIDDSVKVHKGILTRLYSRVRR